MIEKPVYFQIEMCDHMLKNVILSLMIGSLPNLRHFAAAVIGQW